MDSIVSSQKDIIKEKKGFQNLSSTKHSWFKVGFEFIWLLVGIEPENRQILALSIAKERNMFVAEICLSGLVKVYGKHPASMDDGTWYPQACRFLGLNHHLHSSLEKSLIERTMQYIKDEQKVLTITFHAS